MGYQKVTLCLELPAIMASAFLMMILHHRSLALRARRRR